MAKVKSLADLRKMKDDLQTKVHLREKGDNYEKLIQVKVGMGTSGIASGAKEVFNYFVSELEKRNIEGVVTQTGDMGYSFAEPTIEVTIPQRDPIVFGGVDVKKADQIIELYIKNGELVEGILPENYDTIDN